jgi:hypothetical protein
LAGEWKGTSTVESTNQFPDCVPPFLAQGFMDTISAQMLSLGGGESSVDVRLSQEGSREVCHLQLTANDSGFTAQPFNDRGTGAEGEQWCHFRIDTSRWGCKGTPPEVWILGIGLSGELGGQPPTRIRGRMELAYDHRPPVRGVKYRKATVIKTFELVKPGASQ